MKPSLLIMSVLNRNPSFDHVFERLDVHFTTKVVKLAKAKQSKDTSLSDLLFSESAESYNYILLDLSYQYIRSNYRTIADLAEKTIIYEQDACQNYIPDSRWFGDFAYTYKKLNQAKIINTGKFVSEKLKTEGINSTFIPKGYDEKEIKDLSISRTINLGFIGTYRTHTYHERYKTLRHVELFTDLEILRTNQGKEYNDTLNTIHTFFSADCGLGEYMAKNFEAMAAGCLLICFRQGNGEEEALGLVDKENVLLYSNAQEAIEKIQWAQANTAAADKIAHNGRIHAQNNFTFEMLATQLAATILEK